MLVANKFFNALPIRAGSLFLQLGAAVWLLITEGPRTGIRRLVQGGFARNFNL